MTSLQQVEVDNRILAVMAHANWYAFKGAARLAADADISKSALSRVLNGKSRPSYALVHRLTTALEKRLKRKLDPRELLSFDGTYPTPTACQLAGCSGCLSAEAYDDYNNLKPGFAPTRPQRQDRQTPSNPMPLASERA